MLKNNDKKEKEGKNMPDLNIAQAASDAKQKFEHAMDGINADAGGLTKDATKMMMRSILRDLEKVRERLRQLRNDRVGLEQELSFADSPDTAAKVQKDIDDIDQKIIDLEKQEKDLERRAKEAQETEKTERGGNHSQEKTEEKAPEQKEAPVKRRWSKEEIQTLKENYGRMSKKELAAMLGRSVNSIDAKAKKLEETKRVREARTSKENAPGSRRRRQVDPQRNAVEWVRKRAAEDLQSQESKDAMKRAEINAKRKGIRDGIEEIAGKISELEAKGGDKKELKELKKQLRAETKNLRKAFDAENVLIRKADGTIDAIGHYVAAINNKRIDIYNDINTQLEKLSDQLDMARQQGRIGLITMKEAIHKTMIGIHSAIEKLFTNLRDLSAVMEKRAHGMTIASKQLEAVAENQIRSLAGQKLRDIPSETEKVSLREKYHHAKTEAFGKAADKAWQKGATMAGTIAADKAEKEKEKAKLEKMQGDHKRKRIER